ncbi:MAG: hypothetical protein RLZZ501_354 [Pseudomonadota bacterium]|jgi:hypothetical protein
MMPTMPDWLETLLQVAGPAGGLLGLIAGVAVWLARQTLVTHEDLRAWRAEHDREHDALDRRLADGERQFAAILADLDHLPDQDDLDDIKTRIGDIEGSVRALVATIDGLKDVLERVERPLNILVEARLKGD